MLAPIKVELLPYDPTYAEWAKTESARLAEALGENLLAVHHIGSTAVPGLLAKPILDLLPVVGDLQELDRCRAAVEGLGYGWWGEFGLAGRRFCTMDAPDSGRRLVQLHCYQKGSPEITRHLAFRDYLRARPELAAAYAAEKVRCQALHPNDSHAYSDCKNAWIKAVEAEALAYFAR